MVSGMLAPIRIQHPRAPFYFAIQRQLLRQVYSRQDKELTVNVPGGRRSAGMVLSCVTVCHSLTGSTAEGKLQPGDQVLLINSTVVDDLSVERAADIIRCGSSSPAGMRWQRAEWRGVGMGSH